MQVEYIDITNPSVGREHAIRIYCNQALVAVTQGTPDNLDELAVGYLLSEGYALTKDEVAALEPNLADKCVAITLKQPLEPGLEFRHRTSAASVVTPVSASAFQSGDGACDSVRFKADEIAALMQELLVASPKRNNGECVHGAGVGVAGKPGLLVVREDIGRHNALDKVSGWAWINDVSLADKALFITGRISAEMVIKAYRSGARVLVSHKSPTEEALWRAQELGVTLVARCRKESMQVFTHTYRICAE